MKGFSLKNAKWLIAPLITLAIVGAMWGYYAFVYVPDRIQYFYGRNFRILATVGTQITSSIEYYNTKLQKTKNDPAHLEKSTNDCNTPGIKLGKQAAEIEHQFVRTGSTTSWTATFRFSENAETTSCKESFKQLVGPDHYEFDILIVGEREGRVFYQQAPAGIQIGSLDHVIGSKGGSAEDGRDTDKKREGPKSDSSEDGEDTGKKKDASLKRLSIALPDASDVKDVTIAGERYKLFLLPVLVPVLIEAGAPTSTEGRWMIAGLVKTSRFLSECKSISYTLRSVVISLIIVVLVSIPLIRVLTLGKRERVRTLNVVMLGYSLLMGTALLTLFLTDMFAYTSAERRLNVQASLLAGEIATNVRKEIQQAYLQLHLLTERAKPDLELVRSQSIKEQKEAGILATRRMDVIEDPYPFLRMAFWIEPNGDQRIKWFTQSKTTPIISVKDRPYFQHVRDNRLWTIPMNMGEQDHARLWVEPIYTWTTGENAAVLAIPVTDVLPGFENWVAALETKFLSLFNPVLPKGFAYAVMDRTGQVLFHSEERRNLRESFLEETDRNRMVRAGLAGHIEQAGDGLYWGHDLHFVVKPLEEVPWTLVVFRDKELLRTANAEGLTTATILLLLYTLIMSGLFTAAWALCWSRRFPHRYQVTWLWLRPVKNQAYRNIVFFNIGMSVVMVMVLLWGSASLAIAAGVLVPILSVGFGVFQWERPPNGRHKVANAGETLYQVAATSFVMVLGFLPAVAFCKVAYETEYDLLLKQGQASLAAGLLDRELRVRKEYQSVSLPKNRKEEFLQRRLRPGSDAGAVSELKALDVYYRFFADTKIQYVDESPIHKAQPSWTEREFSRLLEAIRIPFNDVATESSGLIANVSGDKTFTWDSASHTELDLYYRPVEGAQAPNSVIKLSSNRSELLNKNNLLEVALVIWILGSTVFLVVVRVGRTIFGSHLSAVSGYRTEQGGNASYAGNVLMLGPHVPYDAMPASSHIIDLESVMVDDTWIDTVRADIAKAQGIPIAFLSWERHMDGPLENQQKLQILRELLMEGRSLLIQSRTDPTHFELNGDTGNHSEAKWLQALRSFSRVYPDDDPGDVAAFEKLVGYQEQQALQTLSATSQEEKRKAELTIKTACRILRAECGPTACLQAIGSKIVQQLDFAQATGGEVLAAITRATTGYYQQLWGTCSRGEQYVLFALARDGFVLTTQPEVRNLMRRGMIEWTPMLRPMNETFRLWIVEEGDDPIYAHTWKKAETQPAWGSARHIVMALLAAMGLFLYATQEEEVGHLLEFATALFAGIPIIAEWLGQLSGEKAAPAAATS